jgi:hypothetical protein
MYCLELTVTLIEFLLELFLLREDRVKERLLLKKMVTKLLLRKSDDPFFQKTIQILKQILAISINSLIENNCKIV